MAAMASRIAVLEKQLKEVPKTEKAQKVAKAQPGKSKSHAVAPETSTAFTTNQNHLPKHAPVDDVLVERGSSSQYFNEVLLSRVIEGDEDGQIGHSLSESASQTPRTTDSSHAAATPSPFNALGILSAPILNQQPSSLHPPKTLAVRLWHAYLDNVDGCSGLKLLHVPTDEVRVFSVIHDPSAASYENLALCFAIYFSALVSLDEKEAHLLLEADEHYIGGRHGKRDQLALFKVGLEQSLAHGDFLDRPTLVGLHALAIYLAALRFCNRGKGLWVLNGLAVRVAQSLGLHRDGQRLKSSTLTPFQAEIRRRLWWHLLSRDGRASEDYGLENTATLGGSSNLLVESDVRLPLNVNDTDLVPGMKALPPEKEGWTSMMFSLIHIGLCQTAQRLAVLAAASVNELSSLSPSEETRAQIMDTLRADIEQRLSHCNPLLPQQRMTILCSRFLLRKLDFVSRLQWALLVGRRGAVELVTDANMVEALAILRPRLFREDGLLMKYAWARQAFPQYHVAMYVLWHLCLRPSGPNVDEAWSAVDTLFSQELKEAQPSRGDDASSTGFGSKFAVLAALKAKAEAIRGRMRDQAGVSGRGSTTSNMANTVNIDRRSLLGDTLLISDTVRAEREKQTAVPLPAPSEPPSTGLFNDINMDLGLDMEGGMLGFGLDDVWSAWGDEQPMLM
ncbi:hypothetical protein Sste5346_004216 [Sporothrix stenoceras]|uniref:Xylanolytic transcriptional activator regulatory domain-containing protein n=1 Tax=Sporothrix stenoceras TaxID=5173 RepID=A0ABR3ZAZ9_9PEZI